MQAPTIVIDMAEGLLDDLFDDEQMARLGRLGRVVRTGGDGSSRAEADILVTGWGTPPLTDLHGSGPALVVHSAGTIRQLVPKSLIVAGLRVTHASAGMARSVAELALSCTLTLLRDLHRVDRIMTTAHAWAAASDLGFGRTVDGTRIGVVGASSVGRIYIELVVALGAEVVVHDPYLSAEDAATLGVTRVDLDDLVRASEVVALHAPVTAETTRFITAERLASMPDGTALVNTARSRLIDMEALERELVSGRLRAALDVFDVEPLPADSPLWSLPNVVLTPHIGAVTLESRRAQGVIVVDEIERFVSGTPLLGEVSAEAYDRLA